jgi:thiol-disulfide isomerase/thioredoxin
VLTALALCLACALPGCGGNGDTASPAAVAKAKKQLLDGGRDAFDKRIASYAGRPVVVNKWASWCGPCRQEFPYFRRQARRFSGKVVFLGVNASDNVDDAARFLAREPLPYPSFKDPDQKIARSFRGDRFYPTTAFYNREGVVEDVHLGDYHSEQELVEDLRRHAG